jgi:LPS export ABC transporter protein LptC
MSIKQLLLPTTCFFLSILAACGAKQPARDVSQKQPLRSESQLSLSGTTIEQANDNGKIVWKIKAKQANYTPDKKTARLEGLTGELFENGKVILQVSALKGTVEEDGKEIILEEKVIAIDPRNQTKIKSEKIEWYPDKKLLLIPNRVTGERPDLTVSAEKGTYETNVQKLNLQGKIVAIYNNPKLQLKTEELSWQIPQQQLSSSSFVEIWQYQNKAIVDRLAGDRAKVSLQNATTTLEGNAILKSARPNLKITTDIVTWNYRNRSIDATKTVTIDDLINKVTLIGNRGKVDLNKSIATLNNGTQAVDRLRSAQLFANDLVWYFNTNMLEALGDIKYSQSKPKLTLVGNRAVGNLKNNQITVNGSQGKQVETKIIPDSN